MVQKRNIAQALFFDYQLPKKLECSLPTEERGIQRDEVKLLISKTSDDSVQHTIFHQLVDHLEEGDVLVVNTSGTLKASLRAQRGDGTQLIVNLSTRINDSDFLVEIRQAVGQESKRFYGIQEGEILQLPNNGILKINGLYHRANNQETHIQLWKVELRLKEPLMDYLNQYGQAIKYGQIDQTYPISYYQTVFAKEVGSSEMPSAGRAFSPELLNRLIAKGVQIVPILLHTGISSLEVNERPYPEYYKMEEEAAQKINQAIQTNKRIIAVGTTVVRTLVSCKDGNGYLKASKGWTDAYVTPDTDISFITGLLTGFHEPKASHLLMMQAFASAAHFQKVYGEAIEQEYYWHEFGDLHLILTA